MHKKKLLIILIVLVVFAFLISKTSKFFPVFFQLIFNKEISLKKSSGNINILLMGVGSGKHDGPGLTDTIIYGSINAEKKSVSLVSIPRDLYVPDLSGKINTAYAIGNSKQAGGGLILTKAVVSKIIGQQIDYVFVIDFDGFVKAVDLIGGLDIEVERSFDDYEYPVEEKREDLCGHTLEEATELLASESAQIVFPCRYTHVHFEKGKQHLDGKTALIFVRSRYAKGEEGTDFARSRRQQKVITAFKDKVLSAETFLNPIKVANLYSVMADNINTDIPTSEFDDFIKLAQKMRPTTVHSYVIEWADGTKKGLLVNPPLEDFEGRWVLIPRVGNGNFSEIQKYVSCIMTSTSCEIK